MQLTPSLKYLHQKSKDTFPLLETNTQTAKIFTWKPSVVSVCCHVVRSDNHRNKSNKFKKLFGKCKTYNLIDCNNIISSEHWNITLNLDSEDMPKSK